MEGKKGGLKEGRERGHEVAGMDPQDWWQIAVTVVQSQTIDNSIMTQISAIIARWQLDIKHAAGDDRKRESRTQAKDVAC